MASKDHCDRCGHSMSFYGDKECSECKCSVTVKDLLDLPTLEIPNFSCPTCGQDLGPSLDTVCPQCLATNNVRFWSDTVNRASTIYGKAKSDLQNAKRAMREAERILEVQREKSKTKDIE